MIDDGDLIGEDWMASRHQPMRTSNEEERGDDDTEEVEEERETGGISSPS